MNLDSLKLVQSSPAKVTFDAGAGFRLVVEPHAPGVFRVRLGAADAVAHDLPVSGRAKVHADMLIARAEAISEAETRVSDDGSCWEVCQGETILQIGKQAFGLNVVKNSEPLMALTPDGIGHDDGRWAFGVALSGDDTVYGLGYTEMDLNRRGEYVVSDDPLHQALPLAWSPKGWGLYVNTIGRVDHDVAESDSGVYEIHAQAHVLDLFLFTGEPSEILNQYTAITGRAGQVSLWAMGAWLKQSPGTSLTQVIEQVEGLRSNGIAIDNVMLCPPMAWRLQESKLAIDWDSDRFPDPKQVLDLFAAKSIQIALPALPAVLTGTPTFEELEDRGWLLASDSGDAYVCKGNEATAGQDFALLDLTHKDVYRQWVERHRQLADDGVAAVVCDVQFDFPDDVTCRGAESGAMLRTLYPMLARQALYEACAGHKVPPEGLVLTHDLVPAGQRYPWQACKQTEFSWAGMRQSIRAALSVGASGLPLQMHALGDEASNDVDPQLYLRWLAACVFSGNFQFESIAQLRKLQDTHQELLAHWMQWRYRLIPYVLGAMEDAARTGLPIERGMAMCFPQDREAHRWDTQFMCGPALLVAPITEPGNKVQVYLPESEGWWDLSTGWRYDGGQTLEIDAGLDMIPVFGREGHMLCLGPATRSTAEFNSAKLLDEVWMFGMPIHNPVVMRNKIRVMQMQGSSYIKGLEGLKILPSEGLEVKRRGAEVRISRAR
ncbi:glycoside hydrolase family 31 protein [Orrella daihaiensis]|uniref:Glycoside hydrolase family 31 protein n=1 Tax=Orrella daihaiensis TaxID=2782176 RepID=A0ABY4AII4_9BURK|nr:glycoside hydrolase family 31 protein [Orrella daihaiensis]UOD49898.1 glycoside hydrolase family 31 protein [Orrella daihaiensis]